MAQYADKYEAEGFGIEFTNLPARFRDQLMNAASRSIDRLCGVQSDFFAAAGSSATARTFYGDGTAFLRVDPYAAATPPTVVMETGYTEPTWIEQGAEGVQFLVVNSQVKEQSTIEEGTWKNRFTGWPDRVSVAVTAKWGFTAVPDEVRQATVELALHTWRKSDPARLSVEGGTPAIVLRDLPPFVDIIVKNLKATYSRDALFA